MKNAKKLLLVTVFLFIALFACVSGCRKSTAHVHVYDDEYDAICNTCGNIRVPARKPLSDINEPSETDAGFVVDADYDGLILEGLDGEYFLSESVPSFDFTAVELNVYLSGGGEKGKAVPKENYSLTVTYGGERLTDLQNLTADGTYTVTVELKDVKTVNRTISLKTNFAVVNPVTAFRFVSGTTTQYVSKTDKMSADWIFEAVRANGDKFIVPTGEVNIAALVTDFAGTRTFDAEYAGFTEQIVCTVKDLPQVVACVDVLYDNSEKFVDEGGVFSVCLNDFNIYVNADGNYDYESSYVLVYDGCECGHADLPARGEPHTVTFKAAFTYTVEGETVTQIFEREVRIKVTARIEEPASCDLVVDGAVISGLGSAVTEPVVLAESVNGEIRVAPADNANVFAGNCAEVEIDGRTFDSALTVEDEYDVIRSIKAISLSLKQPAVISVYFSSDTLAFITFEDGNGNITNPDEFYPGFGSAKLTYEVESGEYEMSVLGAANIYRIEAVFI